MLKKIFFVCMLVLCFSSVNAANRDAYLLTINGAIGPATQEYINKGIVQANKNNAAAVVIQIDTPGGLSKSMRGIIKAILASKIPIIGYVAPSGARAASAGTYLLYACHIAAMAPGTNIGAATPVNIGGAGAANKKQSASEKKAMNDAKAYIRSLAILRGRNVNWAELAVSKAASLSASEALKKNVITLMAPNLQQLLQKSGYANATIVKIDQGWRFKFLSIITDPSIAYLLLIAGFYGLFFEFTNPGILVPGVLGGISLLIGLYGLQMLPISFVGLALILLGMTLMITEVYLPSFGVVGIGGLIALVVGSVFLLDESTAGYTLPMTLIVTVAALSALVFAFIVLSALRSRRQPLQSGQHSILNVTGKVVFGRGKVWLKVEGELWEITNSEGLKPDQRVVVESVEGLKVKIKKQESL